jgi:hypothetical protein
LSSLRLWILCWQEKQEDELRRVRADTGVAQEEALRDQREKLRQEASAAVEQERQLAADRVRQVTARAEEELVTQRRRLITEMEGTVGQKEGAWREQLRVQEETTAHLRSSAAEQAATLTLASP